MDNLGTEERERLFEQFGQSFRPGDQLYAVEEQAEACFLIHSGRVRLSKGLRNRQRCFAVLSDGDLFGEEALSAGDVRQSTAVALTELSVLSFERSTVGVLLKANSEVALRLMGQVVNRLRYAEEQVENSILRDRPSRLLHSLLRALETADSVGQGGVLTLSPLQLSSRTGLEVEVVKALMKTFEEREYLHVEGDQIVVPNVSNLQHLFELLGMKEEVRAGFI